MRLDKAERRKHPRVTFEHVVTGELRDALPVVIRNVSLGGFQLESRWPLQSGEVLRFRGDLPGLELNGRILVTRCVGRGSVYDAGAALLDIGDDGIEELDGWLSEHGVRPTMEEAAAARSR